MKKNICFILVFILMAGSVFAASKSETKLMKEGQGFYAKKQYAKAAEVFEKVLKKNPENTSALTYAGYAYMYMGEKSKALAKLEAAYGITGDEKIEAYIEKLKGGKKAAKKDESALKDADMPGGGAARAAALGGAGIVLPDFINMIDLYDAGFSSSYASRGGGSLVYLSPMLVISSYKTEDEANDTFDRSTTGFGANMYRGNEPFVVLKFFEGNSIILKPRFATTGGKEIDDDGTAVTRDISSLLWGGDIELAQKLGDNLSLGAMFGFDTAAVQSVAPATEVQDRINGDLSKTSFLGSVSYILPLDGMGLSFALSGGSRTPVLPIAPFAIAGFTYGVDDEYARLVSRYNIHNVSSDLWTIIWNFRTTVTEDMAISGLDFNLGVDLVSEEKFEASLVLGISPGIAGKRKEKAVTVRLDTGDEVTWLGYTVDEYDYYKDGMGLSGALKARYFLSDLLVIGAAVDFTNIGITKIPNEGDDPVAETLTLIDVSGGVTVKIGGMLNIPVEGFYQSGTLNEKEPVAVTDGTSATSVFGARTGVEYMATREFMVRLGFDYAAGGASYKLVDSGTTVTDEPSGTADNPGKNKIGIGAGAGYKAGQFDLNAAFRYVINGESQLETGYLSKSSSEMQFIVSALIGL